MWKPVDVGQTFSGKLVPITVPTGDAHPCDLVYESGSFTSLGGIQTYIDRANGGIHYELRITRRGKREHQQWYQEVIDG